MWDADIPAWLVDLAISAFWGLTASCPRTRAASVYWLCPSLSNVPPSLAPTYQGDWSPCSCRHPRRLQFCLPAKQNAPSGLLRQSLLQPPSSQPAVSAKPPTTMPTHRSSEVSCKVRNISPSDPFSRGGKEKEPTIQKIRASDVSNWSLMDCICFRCSAAGRP